MPDFSPIQIAASLVFVGVAAALSLVQRLGLEMSVVWAALRAAAQLVVIGGALALVFAARAPLVWSWLWVVAMVVFAALTVRHRTPEVPAPVWLPLLAFGVAAVAGLGVLFGLGIFRLEARTLVPLAGMLIGNSLAATVLVGRRIVEEVRDKRDLVEARLALGLTSREAVHPHLRAAVRTALIPQIETTKAVGLVVLPGAMTGLIIAGADPMDAVLIQLAIMYLVLGSVVVTTAVVAFGLRQRLFTRDERLVPLPVPPDQAGR